MVSRTRALAPSATVPVAATAGLTVRAPSAQCTKPACSLTAESDDPILATDGYLQAARHASCSDTTTTGISPGIYRVPRRSNRSVMIAQTTRTAAETIIDYPISAPCQIGSWDATGAASSAWPPGTAPPSAGWVPVGAGCGAGACPPPSFAGAQAITLRGTP
jgi:hypothetical protein